MQRLLKVPGLQDLVLSQAPKKVLDKSHRKMWSMLILRT
jgi:hypothetical protein